MYNIRIVCVFFFCMGVWMGGAKRCYAQEKKQVLAERQRYRQGLRHELKGEIQLSGAFALYPMAVKWAEEFRIFRPEVPERGLRMHWLRLWIWGWCPGIFILRR